MTELINKVISFIFPEGGWSFFFDFINSPRHGVPESMAGFFFTGIMILYIFLFIPFSLLLIFPKHLTDEQKAAKKAKKDARIDTSQSCPSVIFLLTLFMTALLIGSVPGWFLAHVCAANLPDQSELFLGFAHRFFVAIVLVITYLVVTSAWMTRREEEYIREKYLFPHVLTTLQDRFPADDADFLFANLVRLFENKMPWKYQADVSYEVKDILEDPNNTQDVGESGIIAILDDLDCMLTHKRMAEKVDFSDNEKRTLIQLMDAFPPPSDPAEESVSA